MSTEHEAIRYGDEYQCSKCGKAWEVNDPEPPPCKTGADHLRDIRAKLRESK
jgi:ABC-type ATPase with predicted acetyltransferase domain